MKRHFFVGCFSLMAALGCGEERSQGTVMLFPETMGAGGVDAGTNPGAEDGALVGDQGQSRARVNARVRIINPIGGAFVGVRILGPYDEAITDTSGSAVVQVDPGEFRLALDAPGARRHHLFGVATDVDFEQITYLSPEMITGLVYGQLGLADDPEKGIVVVGLDRASLAPAIGAEATLDVESDDGFVIAGPQASIGTSIPPNGQGFVTFPNVVPGTASVSATYPGGQCRVFPANGPEREIEVIAGEVSIIAYTCE
ncbi:MAG: hypothetical protein VYA30_05230 [Myxococcota bacterium]|nr:hypothetical protein [Myxococcota bacterium]